MPTCSPACCQAPAISDDHLIQLTFIASAFACANDVEDCMLILICVILPHIMIYIIMHIRLHMYFIAHHSILRLLAMLW